MNPIAFRSATGGSYPSGTGSFDYRSNFMVVLDNLAYNKIVGIWGHDSLSGSWKFYPCNYLHSLPGNQEIWVATTDGKIDQFVVKYQVSGSTFWDNNAGNDYFLNVQAGEGTDGVGTAVIGPQVINEGGVIAGSGHLVVNVALQNLAYQKQVGLVYSTNGWSTWNVAFGAFVQGYAPGPLPHQAQVETWEITAAVGGIATTYAIFYTVNGTTSWDNNFGLNYTAP